MNLSVAVVPASSLIHVHLLTRDRGRVSISSAAALIIALSGCAQEDAATDDSVLGIATTQPNIYFYPPWGVMTTEPTAWAANVHNELSLSFDETDPTTGAVVRHLRTLTPATTPKLLRSVPTEQYGLGWNIDQDTIDLAHTYRITILAGGTELGRTDVPLKAVPILLQYQAAHRDLWVKFRVEELGIDRDLDGAPNWADVCPNIADPSQSDVDHDGIGDACDCEPEICDGRDNDCDGAIDNGNPGGEETCNTGQLGACAAGTTACTGGTINCVQNVQASAELCDGADNDCNGLADDNNPGGEAACNTTHLGVCAAGTTLCSGGAIVCADSVEASEETCNGLDDDCDGMVDENNPGSGDSCTTGQAGICAAGSTSCINGAIACVALAVPAAESCDGLDNDCDGANDDGNPGSGALCGTGRPGVCAAGTTSCIGGTIACLETQSRSNETCNNLDDDCNGATDEGNPGGGVACTTGQAGVCAAGVTVCRSGAIACDRLTAPSAEVCDGLDNDCDGIADNGNPGGGAACSTGQSGSCAAGTTVCSNGAIACDRNNAPQAELCNSLDDDCDGAVDENNPGSGVACTTGQDGVCAPGTTTCQSGAIACIRNTSPSAEVCDAQDNDCNGTADNGNPGGGLACTTGQLGACAAGTTACSSGAIACTRNLAPSAELCDNIDNDCDGAIDESASGVGAACSTGQSGICAAGTRACTSGSLVCNRNAAPATESCNSLDDDCDGAVDEGNPGGGIACTTGQLGACSAGTTLCSGGAVICSRNAAPATEVCNSLDDDCDGAIDEGVLITYYRDADGDGRGTPNTTTQGCSPPVGYVAFNDDCADTDASTYLCRFGTGADGALTIAAGNTTSFGSLTTVTTVSAISGANLTVASSAGFTAGQEVLLINMQGSLTDYASAGAYELRRVESVTNATTLVVGPAPVAIYGTNNSNASLAGQRVYLIRVPNYSSVTINGTLTAGAFNGAVSSLGLIVFKATGGVTVAAGGSINANYIGFLSDGSSCNGVSGRPGESYIPQPAIAGNCVGWNNPNRNPNGGAGGGGFSNCNTYACATQLMGSGGGGGSYGTSGTAGANNGAQQLGGLPGLTHGTSNLSRLFLGSGGGAGAGGTSGPGSGTSGGRGGGLVLISAAGITVNGSIVANGQLGGTNSNCAQNNGSGSGGGGSGGSIYLRATTLTLATVTANGGAGGCQGGGVGGAGRIRIDYQTLNNAAYPSGNASVTSPAAFLSAAP